MRTFNADGLKDFHIMVSHGNLYYGRKLNKWLSFGAQVNGLLHYGIDNISTPDGATGSGPIYEGNLWNRRLMDGSTEFALSQVYLKGQFGNHTITIGQFLKNTPLINIEPWPFPNAMEGLWYENKGKGKWNTQLGFITRISPRQSGSFANIGETIGQAGTGRDIYGNVSRYRSNVNSNFVAIGNAKYHMNANWTVDTWDYFVENVFNVFLLEPQWRTDAGDLRISSRFLYQRKVGEGGNENPFLTYMSEGDFANAYYLGFRVEKKVGDGMWQFNFSRIADQGRLLLPKEWGLEPFYAFQRRTRVEGAAGVTGVMLKYQHIWEDERGKLRLFATGGYTRMPHPTDVAKNKFGSPSFSHWAVSPKYDFKQGKFNKLSFEVYMAYRFRADEVNDPRYIINRNEFFHIDMILGWRL